MLVFLAALGLVILVLIIAMGLEYFKRQKRLDHQLVVASASECSNSLLIKTLMGKMSPENMHVMNSRQPMLSEYFEKLLFEKFNKVGIAHEECSIPVDGEIPQCTKFYHIDTSSGPIIVGGYFSSRDTHTKKGKMRLSHPLIEDYKSAKGEVAVMTGLTFAYTSSVSSECPELVTLRELISSAELAQHEDLMELGDNPTSRFFNFVKTADTGYTLQPYTRKIPRMSKALLSASYSPVNISYKDRSASIPMGDAIDLITATLGLKGNISMFGPTGTGKSYLLDNIARIMGNKSSAVIFITPTMAADLQKTEVLPFLLKEITALREDHGLEPVLCIDEAESLLRKSSDGIHTVDNSFMLSLLDGAIQKMFGCVTLMTFNCRPEDLNPALFRAMRMQMVIHLDQISDIQPLIDILREQNPLMAFDSSKAAILAEQKQVSLAEVYGLFTSPSKDMLLEDLLDKALGVPKKVKPPVIKPPSITPPSVATEQPESIPGESNPQNSQAHKNNKGHGQGKHGNNNKNRNRDRR